MSRIGGPRFSMEQLRAKALAALEDTAARCAKEPQPPSLGLRFTLAFLANGVEERWPFDAFWNAVTIRRGAAPPKGGDEIGRSQTINASLNGIYRQLGMERVGARVNS